MTATLITIITIGLVVAAFTAFVTLAKALAK